MPLHGGTSHTHTHIRISTSAQTRTHTQIFTYTHMQTHTEIHIRTNSNSHIRAEWLCGGHTLPCLLCNLQSRLPPSPPQHLRRQHLCYPPTPPTPPLWHAAPPHPQHLLPQHKHACPPPAQHTQHLNSISSRAEGGVAVSCCTHAHSVQQ